MRLDGADAQCVADCARRIAAGELVGLPTETVYGLAADADNAQAVAQIYRAKGRPTDHPLIVHVLDEASARHFAAEIPEFALALLRAYWPGPLTLIVPRRPGVAGAAAAGQNSVGLRCPAHPVALALLDACAELGVHGLAAPSANPFGRISPTSATHVQAEFGLELPILDGGPCAVGIESTIVDCTRGTPVLLRPGAITVEQIEAVSGRRVLSKEELPAQAAPAPRASGTLQAHYAPRARLRLMDAPSLQTALDVLGSDMGTQRTPLVAVYARAALRTRSAQVLLRRMPDDAAQTARELFAVLREFDAQGVELIWVEHLPLDCAWDGVRDRLQRAAASG